MNPLPTELPCPGCQQSMPVSEMRYMGIFQPIPGKEGGHGYDLVITCTGCGIRAVKRFHLPQKID